MSRFDIFNYHTELIDFFIIEEIADNKGMSITNGAEVFCYQIAERFDIEFKRCRFIERYPQDDIINDITMDLINFEPDSDFTTMNSKQ